MYRHLSADPHDVLDKDWQPPSSIPLRSLRVADPAAAQITDAGEPLVILSGITCINAYANTGWSGTDSTMWIRETVLSKLLHVQDRLPDPFSLGIFDAWRSMTTISALYRHFYGPGSTLKPGFLADPNHLSIVPPHQTGAAVDLTLCVSGTPLSLGTSFDEFTPLAARSAFEEPGSEVLDDLGESRCAQIRELRRLLDDHMCSAGFAPNDQEWWHFSYGDQEWAVQYPEVSSVGESSTPDQPTAIFGGTQPIPSSAPRSSPKVAP
ncbi:MAG TPA: hypothetical protein DEG43_10010 [Acidimicrobiaceae bacterium]|nr:hypothetical protein [Acidimicrobiaceae bacterium]